MKAEIGLGKAFAREDGLGIPKMVVVVGRGLRRQVCHRGASVEGGSRKTDHKGLQMT